MFKVKCYDTIESCEFELTFKTEEEAVLWIDKAMQGWWDILCKQYPAADVTWLNKYLDCGDITEIYVPDTSVVVSCELM